MMIRTRLLTRIAGFAQVACSLSALAQGNDPDIKELKIYLGEAAGEPTFE